MPSRKLTGVLLVGGESRRFGSPKAHARFRGETLAERAWRLLGEACDERLAVGKRGELELPFEVVDDGVDLRAPLAGVVAGLRAATHGICVFLPVDAPLVTAAILLTLGNACRDGARPASTPAPCAFAKRVLPQLEARLAGEDASLAGALRAVDTAVVAGLEDTLLVDTDHPDELARLERTGRV